MLTSKTYATNDPSLTYGTTGLVNGVTVDGVTLTDTMSGSLTRTSFGTLAGRTSRYIWYQSRNVLRFPILPTILRLIPVLI